MQFNLFNRKQQDTVTIRRDRYNDQRNRILCAFQATIERESDCDYDALRAALLWARDCNHPVTMITLRRAYNDVLYASIEFALPTC